MTYVTDTHPLVYRVTRKWSKLGRRARTIFERSDRGQDTIIVSFTVLEELLLLTEINRIQLPMPFREFVISMRQAINFDIAANDTELALEASTFSFIRDPFDRLIVAQARLSGVPLITGDGRIQESGLVRTVWD